MVLGMDQPVKIFTIAHVPDSLRKAWLQHLRDFDAAHPGCHFEVTADCPDLTLTEVVDLLRITPELTITKIFNRSRS
jgi:hypothetical protein